MARYDHDVTSSDMTLGRAFDWVEELNPPAAETKDQRQTLKRTRGGQRAEGLGQSRVDRRYDEEYQYNRRIIERNSRESGVYNRQIRPTGSSYENRYPVDYDNRTGSPNRDIGLNMGKSMRHVLTGLNDREGRSQQTGNDVIHRDVSRGDFNAGKSMRQMLSRIDSGDVYSGRETRDVTNRDVSRRDLNAGKSMRQLLSGMDGEEIQQGRQSRDAVHRDVTNRERRDFNAAKSMRQLLSEKENTKVYTRQQNGNAVARDVRDVNVGKSMRQVSSQMGSRDVQPNDDVRRRVANKRHFHEARGNRKVTKAREDGCLGNSNGRAVKHNMRRSRTRPSNDDDSINDVTDVNSRRKLVAARKGKRNKKKGIKRLSHDLTPKWIKMALDIELKENWGERFGKMRTRWNPEGQNHRMIGPGVNKDDVIDGPSNAPDKRRRVGKRPLAVVVAIIVVLMLAVAVTVPTVVFLTQKQTDTWGLYTLSLTLEGETYTTTLGNKSSADFWTFHDRFCEQVDLKIQSTPGDDYLGCTVTSLTEGSIKVQFVLVFRTKESVSRRQDNITKILNTTSQGNAQSATLGPWTYLTSSFHILYGDIKPSQSPLTKEKGFDQSCITEGSQTGCKPNGSLCLNKKCGCPIGKYFNKAGQSCNEIDCGEPSNITHGRVENTGTKFGSNLTVICDLGYELQNISEVTCQNHSTWGQLPQCQPVLCDMFTPLPNSDVTNGSASSENPVNSTITVQCDVGYTDIGDLEVICLANGSWSVNYSCPIVTCEVPVSPENGEVETADDDVYEYNDTIAVTCLEGYESNTQNATCQANGTWTKVSNCTRIQCENFILPDNASISQRSPETTFGANVTIMCESGFTLEGDGRFTCAANKSWVGDSFCKPIICSPFTFPDNCKQNGTLENVTYGTLLNVSCEDGFSLIGSARFSCKPDGSWPMLQCSQTNCSIDDSTILEHATISNLSETTVSIECDTGYNLNGNATITCMANGTVIGTLPDCLIATCQAFTGIADGTYNGSGNNYRDTRTLTCKSQFIMKGPSEVACQANGTWGKGTECIPECGNYTTPDDSKVLEIDQQTLNVSCNEGFLIEGDNTKYAIVKCHREVLQWVLNNCSRVNCGNFTEVPSNGNIFNQTGTQFGDTVNIVCGFGYELEFIESVTCQSTGEWEASPRCLIVDCGTPPKPANSDTVYSSTAFEADATVRCQNGYSLQGNASLICLGNGSWTDPPSCQIVDCGTNFTGIGLDNVNVTLVNGTSTFQSMLEFACKDDGRRFVTEGFIPWTCNGTGQWDGRTPTCTTIGSVSFNTSTNIFLDGSKQSLNCNIEGAINWTLISIAKNKNIIINVTQDTNTGTFSNESAHARIKLGSDSSLYNNGAVLDVVFDPASCDDDGLYTCTAFVELNENGDGDISTTIVTTQAEEPTLILPSSAIDGAETEVTCTGRVGRTSEKIPSANLTLEVLKQSEENFTMVSGIRSDGVQDCNIVQNVTYTFTPDASFNNAIFRCTTGDDVTTVQLFSGNQTLSVAGPETLP